MVIERTNNMAYKLELPQEMMSIHIVFHISMLKMYVWDQSHQVAAIDLEQENISYGEKSIEILDWKMNKEIFLGKSSLTQWQDRMSYMRARRRYMNELLEIILSFKEETFITQEG